MLVPAGKTIRQRKSGHSEAGYATRGSRVAHYEKIRKDRSITGFMGPETLRGRYDTTHHSQFSAGLVVKGPWRGGIDYFDAAA